MNRIRRSTEERTLDLAPLIDVVFLLLTFFVFSLALAVQLRITDIRLPSGSAGAEPMTQRTVLVALGAEGTVLLDGESLSLDGLSAALTAARAADPELVVYVATDERASAGDLFRLMDAFAAAEIADLRFLRADDPARPVPAEVP